MASPIQRAAVRRKVLYVALILVLLVVNTFGWRGVASPLTGGEPPPWSVTAQANALELNELAVGDPDLVRSTTQLLLTGSRGIVSAVLWYQSDEMKKRHEWNKLELLVRSITKLQPHTAAPWTYQSWNIAYNVSVESDRIRDKYFYITRGIELMGEGIRLNKDHPDMRYMMAFYYQNKFGVSDEAATLRSMFQMSCIDPRDRDASKLRPRDEIDMQAFESFVRTHPQLVRRLRDKLKYGPAEIVDFLRDNRNIPSRYYDPETDQQTGLKPLTAQFPVMPLQRPRLFKDERTQESEMGDDFDSYQAGRAWFSYAMDSIPDPEPQYDLVDRPVRARMTNRRVPKAPAEIIFRHGPARAQSFVGERLEKEGWFDESGWTVDQDRFGSDRWFPDHDVVVGTGVQYAQDAWSKAATMWREHAEANGLYFDPAELLRMEEQAKLYRERYRVEPDEIGRNIMSDAVDSALKASFKAHNILVFYNKNRQMTNFDHHYYRAFAEMDPATIQARKTLANAERLRAVVNDPDRAMEQFEMAFDMWKKVLVKFPQFRDDSSIQEDVYELQLHYVGLMDRYRGAVVRPALVVQGVLAGALAGGSAMSVPASAVQGLAQNPKPMALPILGPLDQIAPDGRTWVSADVRKISLSRAGLDDPPPQPTTPPAAPPTS